MLVSQAFYSRLRLRRASSRVGEGGEIMIAATWETWSNFVSGLGSMLTGLAATFGVIAAYFRFRRSHEARINVSMELTPKWLHLDAGRALVVRVDVHTRRWP